MRVWHSFRQGDERQVADWTLKQLAYFIDTHEMTMSIPYGSFWIEGGSGFVFDFELARRGKSPWLAIPS